MNVFGRRLFLGFLIGFSVLTLAGCQKKAKEEQVVEDRDVSIVVNGQVERSETIDLLAPEDGIILLASDVDYGDGYSDFFVQPTQPGAYPGIILVHHQMGLTDDMLDLAKVLAVYGYSVLAVDLFDGQIASGDNGATLVQSLDKQEALDHLMAAEEYLRNTRAAPKVGVIGRGFGGDQALQLAISSDTIDSVTFYYAKPRSDELGLKNIDAQVLGIYGKDDDSVSVSSIENFSTQLSGFYVDHSIFIYPDVGHDFAEVSSANFAPEESKQAWKRVLIFLQGTLY